MQGVKAAHFVLVVDQSAYEPFGTRRHQIVLVLRD
jgi:hypothetical protein